MYNSHSNAWEKQKYTDKTTHLVVRDQVIVFELSPFSSGELVGRIVCSPSPQPLHTCCYLHSLPNLHSPENLLNFMRTSCRACYCLPPGAAVATHNLSCLAGLIKSTLCDLATGKWSTSSQTVIFCPKKYSEYMVASRSVPLSQPFLVETIGHE